MAATISVSTCMAALVIACTSAPQPTGADATVAPAPTLGGTRDSFPDDASVGVQARFVLGGCVGGPETSCHGIGAGGMVLPDGTPSHLIGVPSTEDPSIARIKRGDPANSYVYRKVMGGPAIDGGRMPLDQEPLDARSLRAIAEWIEAGAP